jgi:hypothetical protein
LTRFGFWLEVRQRRVDTGGDVFAFANQILKCSSVKFAAADAEFFGELIGGFED